MRCFKSSCCHKNTQMSTMKPVLELFVEFFQDSIGLNCQLEFRRPGSEQPIQYPQKQLFKCFSGLLNKNRPVYFGKSIFFFFGKVCQLLLFIIYQMQVFNQKNLALPIQWLVFLLSIVLLALSPFFLKVPVGFRAFKLLKDGCFNRPHFNKILLGLKNKTNRKDPDSASEIIYH